MDLGVKGLLRMRRESFVVCALRSVEASRRTLSGLGAFSREAVDALDVVGVLVAVFEEETSVTDVRN